MAQMNIEKQTSSIKTESLCNFTNIIKFDEDNVYIKVRNFQKMDDYTELLTNFMKMFNYFNEKQKKYKLVNFLHIHFDFEKFSLSKLDIDFIKELFLYLQNNFENIIKVIYCKNITNLFKVLFFIIKPFIDKQTKSKLKFIKKSSNKNKIKDVLSFDEASQIDFEID